LGGRGLKQASGGGSDDVFSCIARSVGRARIETSEDALINTMIAVSPAQLGGRGLKRQLDARQLLIDLGIARSVGRARIETLSLPAYGWVCGVSPAQLGGRGLKHRALGSLFRSFKYRPLSWAGAD